MSSEHIASEYDAEALNRSLLPPPRIRPFTENWPVIEPPFRDQRPPYEQEAEEWEAVESSPIPEDELMVLSDELQARVRRAALQDERVRELVVDKRTVVIGASLRESKDPEQPATIVFVLYSYDDNQAIEVWLEGDDMEVTEVSTANYQPALLQEEIERALELARRHENLAGRLSDELVGMAIQVTVDDPLDPRYNHRLFDIRFGCADERLPRYQALVDLSTEEVIGSGAMDSICGGDDHE